MIALEGAGIHTGAPCRVEFALRGGADRAGSAGRDSVGFVAAAPAPATASASASTMTMAPTSASASASAHDGVRLLLPSAGGGRALYPRDLAAMPRSARRATVLRTGDGDWALHTPEHLLAALLFFADSPLDVAVRGGEAPNLDGSALPFREAMAALLPERAEAPAWREYPVRLRWDREWDGGWIRVRPAPHFAATYTLERGGLSQTARVESPGQAWHEVLPARTWITHREWLKGREEGLLRGAGEGSGLLLAESPEEHAGLRARRPDWDGAFPLLSPSAFRLEAEPARHKLLDLLGDLALLGLALPSAEIGIKNGGHAVNHELLGKLQW